MSRIGASISGAERYLLNQLAKANQASTAANFRLSTGKKINRPADNVSGFMQLSGLESRLSKVNTTLTQVSAASTMGAQLQLTLDQVRTQLNSIRTTLLTDEAQTLTTTQRSDAQTSIDGAITQINSLAGTEINDRRVLDNSANFSFSGLNVAQIRDLQVISTNGSTIAGTVSSTATQATKTYTGSSSRTTAAATFTLTGSRGNYTFSVVNSQLLTSVATSINQYSHVTGITANAVGNVLTFTSVDYGTNQTLGFNVTSGTFNTAGAGVGTNATATINGAVYTGDGNRFNVNSNGLRFTAEFAGGFTGAFSTVTISNTPVLKYALSTDITKITRLGLPGVSAALFRGLSGSLDQLATGGTNSGLSTNTSSAIRIVDEALSRLTALEARVDSFTDITVATSSALLSGFQTTLEDAITDLNTVNEDEENLTIAKHENLAFNASAALSILQQQRSQFVSILQQIAGLG